MKKDLKRTIQFLFFIQIFSFHGVLSAGFDLGLDQKSIDAITGVSGGLNNLSQSIDGVSEVCGSEVQNLTALIIDNLPALLEQTGLIAESFQDIVQFLNEVDGTSIAIGATVIPIVAVGGSYCCYRGMKFLFDSLEKKIPRRVAPATGIDLYTDI